MTRTLEDLIPKARAIIAKVQGHKGWDDAGALEWLDQHVYGWQTAILNAGNWIVGADPNLHTPAGPYTRDQILTPEEARTLRKWHSHPWQVMPRAAWERWTRSLWRIPAYVSLYPPPEIPDALRRLEIIWPVEWWPHADGQPFEAAPIKDGWGRVDYHDLDRLLGHLEHGEQGYGPYVTALVVSPQGVFRLFRNAFQDWYEGHHRPGEGK